MDKTLLKNWAEYTKQIDDENLERTRACLEYNNRALDDWRKKRNEKAMLDEIKENKRNVIREKIAKLKWYNFNQREELENQLSATYYPIWALSAIRDFIPFPSYHLPILKEATYEGFLDWLVTKQDNLTSNGRH